MKWTRFRRAPARLMAAAAVVAVGVGFGVAALTGSFPAQANSNVVYVNDNAWPDIEGCKEGDNPKATIAEGITAVDPGGTVIVCDGTYAGTTITKSVTIEGRAEADRENVTVQGASDGLVVDDDDVTIRHLTLEGAGTDRGIWVKANADDAIIDDVEISNWDFGIRIEDNEDALVQSSLIKKNASDGISASGSEGTVIKGNTIGDALEPNEDDGIELLNQDQTVIEDNTILNNTDNQIELDGSMHVRIVGNVIDTGSDGIVMTALAAEGLVQIGGSPENANTFTGTLGTDEYYIYLACGAENTVDATYNWWGTADRETIGDDFIFNDEDDPLASTEDCTADVDGAVVFHPWATGPAPTPTPSPTPTASPTATPTATATATATPTATPPPPTRDFDLPAGWNDFVWTGVADTEPATALNCIAGTYPIAYRFMETTQTFQRYVPDDPLLSNMGNLDQYESLLVLVTPAATQCLGMPVAP